VSSTATNTPYTAAFADNSTIAAATKR
jgi:hypothetical protein